MQISRLKVLFGALCVGLLLCLKSVANEGAHVYENEEFDDYMLNKDHVKAPLILLETRKSEAGESFTYVWVQSQENGTMVQDVSINAGACEVLNTYTMMGSEERYIRYAIKTFGDEPLTLSEPYKFKNKAGETIRLYENISVRLYESLESAAKELFYRNIPTMEPIGYGEYFYIAQTCAEDEIKEVVLTINGGEKLLYEFD